MLGEEPQSLGNLNLRKGVHAALPKPCSIREERSVSSLRQRASVSALGLEGPTTPPLRGCSAHTSWNGILGKTGRQRLSWQTVQKFQRLWEGGVSFTCGRNLRGTFRERPLSFLVVFTRACRNGVAGRWGTPGISLASVGVTLRPWLWLCVS